MPETYPKGSKNPSSKYGEQKMRSGWGDTHQSTHYPTEGGAEATIYQGDRSHTKVCGGGYGSPNKSDYPGHKYETFGTEKLDKR